MAGFISSVLLFLAVLALFIAVLTGCKKESISDKVYDATLTYYSMHAPFTIKYTDSGVWYTETITGNSCIKQIKATQGDFAYSQQIKSVASYPVDSLYIRADIDGKKAERGFKGLYMQIEIDISLSQAQ